jgi:quercetin dioxygenase-like cupin family protein
LKKLPALLLLALSLTLQAQQPLPPNYQTILTNQTFNVIRVHYGPHEKVPVHDHPATSTVYVYLNNSGPVNIIHENPPSTITRPPTHLGAFRISRGVIERHSIENLSDLPSDFLRVELPHLNLPADTPDFRGPAPTDLTHNLSSTEFSSAGLSVLRVLCATPTPCAVPATPAPSVLITLSGTSILHNGQPTKIGPGTVVAIAPNQSFEIAPATPSEPAHILLISSH